MTDEPEDFADLDVMIDVARGAMARAYAPYSSFPVGACVRGESGALYAGCNVENASYPVGTCAEAGAFSAMIVGGDRRAIDIVVMGTGEALVTPCGACRQRIREFLPPTGKIHICGPEGLRRTFTCEELLPASFGPENLDK